MAPPPGESGGGNIPDTSALVKGLLPPYSSRGKLPNGQRMPSALSPVELAYRRPLRVSIMSFNYEIAPIESKCNSVTNCSSFRMTEPPNALDSN